MEYKIRFATPDDRDPIYALKKDNLRFYVAHIWGWDEDYQAKDFDEKFLNIQQFNVIEVANKFAGFVQYSFEYPYFEVANLHLLPEYRGKGIGSEILRYLQKVCIAQDRKIRIGCFKRMRDSICIFAFGENYSVAAVETGGKQMSPGHLHLDRFESLYPTLPQQKWPRAHTHTGAFARPRILPRTVMK